MPLPSLDQLVPSGTAQAAAPATAQATGQATGQDYGELQPVINALQEGNPGAVYFAHSQFGGKYEEIKPKIDAELPKLQLASVDLPSGHVVFYNPKVVTTEQITQADAEGKLDAVAESFLPPDQGAAAPAEAAPAAPVDVTAGLTGAQPAPAAGSGDVSAALAPERAANIASKPPVKRALPSRGILDDLAKRAN